MWTKVKITDIKISGPRYIKSISIKDEFNRDGTYSAAEFIDLLKKKTFDIRGDINIVLDEHDVMCIVGEYENGAKAFWESSKADKYDEMILKTIMFRKNKKKVAPTIKLVPEQSYVSKQKILRTYELGGIKLRLKAKAKEKLSLKEPNRLVVEIEQSVNKDVRNIHVSIREKDSESTTDAYVTKCITFDSNRFMSAIGCAVDMVKPSAKMIELFEVAD